MGLIAFRESFLSSDPANVLTFESIDARQMRYQIYWSMFENTSYRRIHNWTTALKHQFALYKYIRNLYNPAYRIGSFYAAHLWGGWLSPTADNSGAIPIEIENESLRTAIAVLWEASNMPIQKDIIALRGTIEGDTLLRVVDNVPKEQVYIERVNPSTVVDLTPDTFGNIKGYIVEEQRPDPKNSRKLVTYREIVTRNGDNVVYATFLNNRPYGWNGQPEQWENAYTFVPMVLIKHMDVGLDWGWSELHPMHSKVMEVDDLASMISDQIRKTIDPVWLMKGMKSTTLKVTGAQADESGGVGARPAPGREELKAIWNASAEAKAEPMIASLDLKDALQHVDSLLAELERDYPELQQDIWATGATSGRALRVARQRVESKVLQRRTNYDAGLMRIHQMAIAIGGWRGYEGYKGFNLDSYAKGDLAHTVAQRPVFTPDPMDATEISNMLWRAAETAVAAGADLAGYLKQQGWDEEQIQEVVKADEPQPIAKEGEQDEGENE